MKKAFISFSSTEYDEAARICNVLEEAGVPCFIANRDLKAGREYAEQLITSIEDSEAVILLLSNASNKSPHVLREIEHAVSYEVPIIVYKLEEVELSKSMEYFLMTHQWITDSKDKDNLLISSVKSIVEKNSNSRKRTNKEENSSTANAKRNKKFKPIYLLIAALIVCIVALSIALFLSKKSKSSSEDSSSEKVSYEVGDTVVFGTYYDEPIEWRVLKINTDGTLVLISQNILTIKSYDAPEGGEYNTYNGVDYWSYENHDVTDEELLVKIRGNNDWSKCNLRAWLNSDGEVVYYQDQAPTLNAVGENYYISEPGFLYQFTAKEKDALVTVRNITPANSLSVNVQNGNIVTEDKVYLLSSDELNLFTDAGISMYAKPTAACEEHDNYHQYYLDFTDYARTDNYYWYLRDNSDDVINHINVVVTEYESEYLFFPVNCGSSDYGVRPVITVDLH